MSLDFDGVDDIVLHGDIAAIDGAAALTVCAWVNMDFVNEDVWVCGKGTGGHSHFGVDIGLSVSGEVFCQTDGVNFARTNAATVSASTWTHLAVVYDGSLAADWGRVVLYVNGASTAWGITNGTPPATLPTSVDEWRIAGVRTNTLDGRVGHHRVWTAALTTAQISQEVNSYRPVRTENLVLWSPYDDGTDARDYSGSGNHGTVTGALAKDGPPVGYGAPVLMLP